MRSVLQTGENSVSITELPVRSWTQPYKEYLETQLKGVAPAGSSAAGGGGGAAGRGKKAAARDGDDAGGGAS